MSDGAIAAERVLWRAQAPVSAPAPPLRGDADADVAIVGGGYVGLWTAIRIKQRDPAADVVVIEREQCGAGASGRNGGQAHGWWRQLSILTELCGAEEALRLVRAADAALEEIGALDASGELSCDFARSGLHWTATTPAQVGAWEETVAHVERNGGEQVFQRLTQEELWARTGSRAHLAGVLERPAAAVHPGKLARGLRERALALGVRLHEGTAMVALERGGSGTSAADAPAGAGAIVVTPHGRLRARRVVLATNAWAIADARLRQRLYVVSSQVVATAPVPERLAALGLGPDLRIHDSQDRVLYYGTTRDLRFVLGRGGGSVALGSRLGAGFADSERWAADAASELRRLYPTLADVPLERHWAGPVDRTTSGLPLLGRLDARGDVLVGLGWSGTGIVQAAVGGDVLASLALGLDDEWSRSALVDAPVARRLPPEPLRWLGAQLVRGAVVRVGRAQLAAREPHRVVRALAGLVPRGPDRRR
ncbi:FAD-binding oxidoreductase [Conexibacter sp. JD483]|uniref:NAD(P)/FAD-dependent oxidoreductase n=1 Tax=unclassified Conexibacter TaxID=2627773 RepID=UPI00271FBE2D|nr:MULTISPECIES: FAD-binding oxidoreductase [unclassified Conexibacter]MDO8188583.1 FAD-binding oxidoreductase [Conexibacter sp. CPCC 205706]MDO8201470.1 FAD-binding oxidoreductase [Conexibacter sp. CPCC 205762]MDR9372104.1 FAD-binding oxidoreductase [Conexibacter sp. JD483]